MGRSREGEVTAENRGRGKRFLVLQGDVADEDAAVVQLVRHVGVAPAVVEHQAAHEGRLRSKLVLHVHDLDQVQI
jgi:hypothetical protein